MSREDFEAHLRLECEDADLSQHENGDYRDERIQLLFIGWRMQEKVRNRELYSGRIRKFFADNPDEELTYDDFKVKFELTDLAARTVVGRLAHQEGFLERVDVVRRRDRGMQ